ncbi:hypothetical protein BGZ94_006920 [Podila epigama]|nr:hypothetical protein BGZ94_006920 [Podila epigama]
MSATTTPPPPPAEKEDPIQGSAPVYKRHLLICSGVPAKDWVKKPELSDPYLNLLSTSVRGQGVNVNLTDEPSTPAPSKDTSKGSAAVELHPSKGPRHDLILFPDNIKFKGVRYEAFKDLNRYLEKYPVGTLRPMLETAAADSEGYPSSIHTELVPGSGEVVTIELVPEASAVLVCVHGSRDCRCGDQGGEFYNILRDMIRMTGLSQAVKVYGVSHIGGHRYAPNTIMYPSGDWHGNLSVLDSSDAQQILFDALANGGMAAGVREPNVREPVMIDKWRGRIGMSKEEQLKLYEQVLEKRRQKSADGQQKQAQAEAQSLFSAPGEELYEDDGLKEQPNAVSIEANRDALPSQLNTNAATTTETTTAAGSAEEANSPRKVKVIFETFQKVRTEIEAKEGERILDIVKDKDPSRHGVYQALECTCGGELECATCHVYIEEPYKARLAPMTDAEEDMLEYAIGRRDSSRLGCQIKMKPELEGMVIKLPQY